MDKQTGKPTLMDGATGTKLWAMAEAAGAEKAPAWTYNLTHPAFVKEALLTYLRAGSRLLMTNTFVVNRYELKNSSCTVEDTVRAALRIAKEARAEFEKERSDSEPIRIFLDAGPLPVLPEPYGETPEEECAESYREIFAAGAEAGADGIMLETFYDLNLMELAVKEAVKTGLPVFATMTFQANGRTFFGASVPEICEVLEAAGAQAIGLNCSLGPREALPILEEFSRHSSLPLIAKPNAGLPAGDDPKALPYTPESFAEALGPALPLLSYAGACCGSDEAYIKALAKRIP